MLASGALLEYFMTDRRSTQMTFSTIEEGARVGAIERPKMKGSIMSDVNMTTEGISRPMISNEGGKLCASSHESKESMVQAAVVSVRLLTFLVPFLPESEKWGELADVVVHNTLIGALLVFCPKKTRGSLLVCLKSLLVPVFI